MTEEQNNETTVNDDKKDYARRWGIVGLGVAVATLAVAKAFSSDESETVEETVEVEVEYDPATE